MYGEVFKDHPINWFTGEKEEGTFIVLSEFLAELEELKAYDRITIHLSSVGGDAYAGVAISNRLKELPGEVIIRNDSLAASAGSVIMQGATKRLVRRASSTMVHNAAVYVSGYFNKARLDEVGNMLDGTDDAIVEAYTARGIDREQVIADMAATTWMTGREAVEKGYADEVIEDGEDLGVTMAYDKSYMLDKGHRLCAMWMPDELPEGIDMVDTAEKTESAAENAEDIKNEGGISEMEVTNLTELCAAYPELTDQLTAQAQAAERERIHDINDIARNVTNSELVNRALYGEERMSARDFAFEAMKAGAVGTEQPQRDSAAAAVLNALDADAADSGADGVKAATNMAQRDGAFDPKSMTDEQIKAMVNDLYENKGV